MEKNELDKFKRQMALPKEYSIGGDKFTFIPLDCDDLPDYVACQDILKDVSSEKMLEVVMSPENLPLFTGLIKKFVRKSYPSLPDDMLKAFVLKNYGELLVIMSTVNSPGDEQEDVLAKVKQIQNANSTT
jgi:hypothetical protein